MFFYLILNYYYSLSYTLTDHNPGEGDYRASRTFNTLDQVLQFMTRITDMVGNCDHDCQFVLVKYPNEYYTELANAA